jgi:hypothetical protein
MVKSRNNINKKTRIDVFHELSDMICRIHKCKKSCPKVALKSDSINSINSISNSDSNI